MKHDTKLFTGLDWTGLDWVSQIVRIIDHTRMIQIVCEIPNTGKTLTGLVK